MIQINLLPDVKEQYIRTERTKRMVFMSSLIVIGISIFVVGLLISVAYGAQKLQLNSLQSSIDQKVKQLTDIKDLDKILTIQNQLNSLTALHDKKVIATNLFSYLPQVTPNDVFINDLKMSADGETSNKLTITGSAKSLESINRYVDTLKFTKYEVTGSTDQKNAFSSVVLTSFSVGEKQSTYTIDLVYNSVLFDQNSRAIKLVVPKQVTTRSQIERPEVLFNTQAESSQ